MIVAIPEKCMCPFKIIILFSGDTHFNILMTIKGIAPQKRLEKSFKLSIA
jgi:hypothetical protein